MPSHELKYVMLVSLAVIALLIWYVIWWHRLKSSFSNGHLSKSSILTSTDQIEELERSLGGILPKSLREAYRTGRLATLTLPAIFKVKEGEFAIAEFMAADRESNQKRIYETQTGADAFIFASDDFGNYYFVRANEPTLYFWDHELGTEIVFESIENLWSLLDFHGNEKSTGDTNPNRSEEF